MTRFFGDFLRSAIEWDEAGRRLQIRWAPEAVVITHGDLDQEVQEEERRFIDPETLNELRRGIGESYRQSLAQILANNRGALTFRPLYEALVLRVGHRPSRGTVRTILSASPEFIKRGQAWEWQEYPEAARVFRRNIVLTELGLDARVPAVDLGRLASAVAQRVSQLAGTPADAPVQFDRRGGFACERASEDTPLSRRENCTTFNSTRYSVAHRCRRFQPG